MAIKQLFAGASLLLLAFAAAPVAYASNDGDSGPAPGASNPSTSPPAATRPHHGPVDPAKRAAWRARREARRQAHQRAHGTDPSATGPAPN
jgi:hypothetical protein